MSVNNSINSGSAPTITLNTADLIVVSDVSADGALGTCEAQDIADLSASEPVAGKFIEAAVTFTDSMSILYSYNISSVTDNMDNTVNVDYDSPLSGSELAAINSNIGSQYIYPISCYSYITGYIVAYSSFVSSYTFFVAYEP